MLLRLLILFAALGAASGARAFGPLGHEVVAEIASRHLAPHARAEVERLLGDRASNAMREASGWADLLARDPAHARTKPWHYVNFARGSCRYDAVNACRGGNCAQSVLLRNIDLLRDHDADDAERADALRWVIHLVADVHQPLHAGYGDDRGGNTIQIQLGRKTTNLHQLWDSGLINLRGLRATRYADFLLGGVQPPAEARWSDQSPTRWLEESCAVIENERIYATGKRVDDAYVRRELPVVERRLLEAGLRLASTLNAALGD